MALPIMARSPKSWLISLRYGVSPQPGQAPENSKSGCNNCEPLITSNFDLLAVDLGDFEEEVKAGALDFKVVELRFHVDRLVLDDLLARAGQTSTHTPQPVQSSGATWIES